MTASETLPSVERRLRDMGLELPAVRPPAGTYVHAVQAGGTIYLSGHPPVRPDGSVVFGRLGDSLDADAGYQAARIAAAGLLATLRDELGTLDRVERLIRLYGVVNATPDFNLHTQVINGASDLLVEAFGERGQHARLAVGVSSLPYNICLEVDLVASVRP
jgi:enamine deaminase RidA (YjgF/YER057c/UK114 family)